MSTPKPTAPKDVPKVTPVPVLRAGAPKSTNDAFKTLISAEIKKEAGTTEQKPIYDTVR